MPYVFCGCRALLFVVFLVAVTGKVRNRAAFAEFSSSIAALRLLPRRASGAVAAAVVGVEFTATVLLAVTGTAVAGLVVATGLLVAFTVGIVASLRRGQRVACQCFGASVTPLGPMHVVRNLLLAAAGAAGVTAAAMTGPAWPTHPAGVALTLAAALVGGLIVIRLDDLAFLFTDTKRDSAP